MAQWLIQIKYDVGDVIHVANAQGKPLCKSRINPTLWHLHDQPTTKMLICNSCKLALAKQMLDERQA